MVGSGRTCMRELLHSERMRNATTWASVWASETTPRRGRALLSMRVDRMNDLHVKKAHPPPAKRYLWYVIPSA